MGSTREKSRNALDHAGPPTEGSIVARIVRYLGHSPPETLGLLQVQARACLYLGVILGKAANLPGIAGIDALVQTEIVGSKLRSFQLPLFVYHPGKLQVEIESPDEATTSRVTSELSFRDGAEIPPS